MEGIKTFILPKLESMYHDLNREYENIINGLYLLRNPQTGEYVNLSYKSFVKVPVMEWAIVFNRPNSRTTNIIYDCLSLLAEGFQFRIYIYPAVLDEDDYSSAHILKRIKDDGFCICNNFNDNNSRLFSIQDCLSDGDYPLTLLPYITKDFPNYSWDNKKTCIKDEPIQNNAIDRKYYALYAALANKWANENFLEVPAWVKKPFFTNPTPYYFGYGVADGVPYEFKAHNVIADFNEFINV